MPAGIREKVDRNAKNYNHMVNVKSQVLWQLRGESKGLERAREKKGLPQEVEFELKLEE